MSAAAKSSLRTRQWRDTYSNKKLAVCFAGTVQSILGSAGVTPVVFGVPPKTFARRTEHTIWCRLPRTQASW